MVAPEKGQAPADESALVKIARKPAGQFNKPFTLSWTHYVLFLTIRDPDERSFFEIEATHENWSLSELKRQKASALYQRLALSRDKAGVKRLAERVTQKVAETVPVDAPLLIFGLSTNVNKRFLTRMALWLTA